MKDLILVVEDNAGMLLNLKVMLEYNNYEVITAINGKKGLEVLSKAERLPDLIISDIMMPEMDGYDFFEKVSENPKWNQIPFFFLTARAAPEDIRLGKMLGADDYLTKPFKEEDLLATVAGKITRKKKAKTIIKKMNEELLDSLRIEVIPSITEEEKEQVYLVFMLWDELEGPTVIERYPGIEDIPFQMDDVGIQLFQAAISIYGYSDYEQGHGLLLNIHNIKRTGYIYFDALPDTEVRGGHRLFMVATIAPGINYYESLRIKKVCKMMSSRIKNSQDLDMEECWSAISEILTTPIV